jgi:hypothetical protein
MDIPVNPSQFPDASNWHHLPFSRRIASGIAALIVSIACIRITSTYRVFCQTFDEPDHLACGTEWLDRGTYTFEPLHPPLARIAAAIGPFLAGCRLRINNNWKGGNDILYAKGRYSRNLSLARLGELPFFVLAAAVVWAWSRRLFGETVAVISVLIFTLLPPILGNAGLATTDIAAAATCAATLYAFVRWLDQGDITRSLLLALTLALAVLSKFTALLFLPACGLALLGGRWWSSKDASNDAPVWQKQRVLALGLAAVGACLLIWTGYRFSSGPLAESGAALHWQTLDAITGGSGRLHDLAHYAVVSVSIPAPEFFRGLEAAKARNDDPSGVYILGRIRQGICWYFFVVALAVKSPLAFLILVGVGVAMLLNHLQHHGNWRLLEPTVAAATILLVTMPVKIHLGVRQILVVYPLFSIAAGFGATSLWRHTAHRRLARTAALLFLGWLVVSSVRAHPDYFPYFNELAGNHPERIFVESDLDWGQDLLRLGEVLRSHKMDKIALSYFGTADPRQHGLPSFTELVPFRPTTGWIAISMCNLKEGWPELGAYSWLEAYKPALLVGRSILLYDIPRTPSGDSGKTQPAVSNPH